MGDGLVEPSPLEGAGADEAPPLYTEIFFDVLPFYIYIGMPQDEFWHGAPWLVKTYRDVYEMKRREKSEDMWLQGLYFYEAIARTAPLTNALAKEKKAIPYLTEPIPTTTGEIREQRERQEAERQAVAYEQHRIRMSRWAESVNREFEAKEKQAQAGD